MLQIKNQHDFLVNHCSPLTVYFHGSRRLLIPYNIKLHEPRKS